MNRTTRSLVSLVCLVTVVFTQLAVSAYACPMQGTGLDETSHVTTNASCDDVGSAPALCQKHCEDGQQNVNTASPSVPAAIVNSFWVSQSAVAAVALPLTRPTPSLHHATSPPLAIRHCRFRI